jgi:hypothetical protein
MSCISQHIITQKTEWANNNEKQRLQGIERSLANAKNKNKSKGNISTGTLTVGSQVELHSLQSKPQHNGAHGQIIAEDEDRFTVKLDTTGIQLKIKPDNLRAVDEYVEVSFGEGGITTQRRPMSEISHIIQFKRVEDRQDHSESWVNACNASGWLNCAMLIGRQIGHDLIVSESKLHLAMIYFYTGQKDTAVKYLGQYLQMWTCESMKKCVSHAPKIMTQNSLRARKC